jgi:ankyrin repeat protein
VAALCERQAELDVGAVNDEGITALIAASSEGHKAVVELLLTKTTAAVNAQDKDGTSAVMAAAVRGHNEVVEVLLAHRADVNMQNSDGHTALMFAYNGRNQVASLLDKYSEYMTKDAASKDNSTAIIEKALETHTGIIELLLAHGADPLLKDAEGNVAVDFDYKPKAEAEASAALGETKNAASANKAEL